MVCVPPIGKHMAQWKPLNVITLGQRETSNIIQILTEQGHSIVDCIDVKWASDNFN